MKEIILFVYLISNPFISVQEQRGIAINAVKQINAETVAKMRIRFMPNSPACSTKCKDPTCASIDLYNCYAKRLRTTRAMRLVIAPPYIDAAQGRWFLGYSSWCSKTALSFITAQKYRTNGEATGLFMSYKDAVHELGHALGADHSRGENVMNPGVCSLAGMRKELHFTRFQGHVAIKSCMKKWK